MKLSEKILNICEGKILMRSTKRAEVREGRNNVGTDISKANKKFNLEPSNIVGWIANKHNKSDGWLLYQLNPSEKSEFGSQGVYRTFSSRTDTTNVLKVNIEKGTMAFVDNTYYEETDKVKFEKMTAYDRVIIEPTEKGAKEFNVDIEV